MRLEPEIAEVHHRHRVLADDEEALADTAHRTATSFTPVGLAAEAERIAQGIVSNVDGRNIDVAIRTRRNRHGRTPPQQIARTLRRMELK